MTILLKDIQLSANGKNLLTNLPPVKVCPACGNQFIQSEFEPYCQQCGQTIPQKEKE